LGRPYTASGYFGEELVKAAIMPACWLRAKPANRFIYTSVMIKLKSAMLLTCGVSGNRKPNIPSAALDKATGETFACDYRACRRNLVRFANISTEFMHSASKWGCGAVMGSKNLKAIAVKGTIGPQYADHTKVWSFQKIR